MDENNQGLQWSHIEPLCILRALARQLWMLLLAALTCVMAAWIVLTCFVTQQYTSSTTFSVTTRWKVFYAFLRCVLLPMLLLVIRLSATLC